MLPKASLAVTVKVAATPAVASGGKPDSTRGAAAAGLTVMGDWEPGGDAVTGSVVLSDWATAVLRGGLKGCAPAVFGVALLLFSTARGPLRFKLVARAAPLRSLVKWAVPV